MTLLLARSLASADLEVCVCVASELKFELDLARSFSLGPQNLVEVLMELRHLLFDACSKLSLSDSAQLSFYSERVRSAPIPPIARLFSLRALRATDYAPRIATKSSRKRENVPAASGTT